MRPRIGVLDLRVAVVLDARPHRWRACRRWCQGILPVSGCAYVVGSLLNVVEPWVMVSSVGDTEYCTPLFVATKADPVCTGSSISTD
jgi:hypothetical protein